MIGSMLLFGACLAATTFETQLIIPVNGGQTITWPSNANGKAYIWSDDNFYSEVKRTTFNTFSGRVESARPSSVNGYLAGQLHFDRFSAVFHPLNSDANLGNIDSLSNAGPSGYLDEQVNVLMNDLFKIGFYFENLEVHCLNSTNIQSLLEIDGSYFVGDSRFTGTTIKLAGPGYALPRLLKSNKLLVTFQGVQEIWKRSDGGIVVKVDGYGKIASVLNLKSLAGAAEFNGGNPTFTGASTFASVIINPDGTVSKPNQMTGLRIAGIVIGSIIIAGIILAFLLIVKSYRK